MLPKLFLSSGLIFKQEGETKSSKQKMDAVFYVTLQLLKYEADTGNGSVLPTVLPANHISSS